MFKLLVVLSLIAVIQCQIPGGYGDRPELVEDVSTRAMIRLAVLDLKSKNIIITPTTVVSVQSQSMVGTNFKIVFTARSASAPDGLTCTTIVYEHWSLTQSVTSVDCV
ncbi:unnamed protein product [Adineta steineri]|uniref:Uncharacterized protein n=1 Tax=Adineta steineri TaxID=433720 RepID=A0A813RXC7_9BILA|nr:unnamed protein product [Adineta steineri]CAF1244212.1 unnamed protein product [Adineta steineri]